MTTKKIRVLVVWVKSMLFKWEFSRASFISINVSHRRKNKTFECLEIQFEHPIKMLCLIKLRLNFRSFLLSHVNFYGIISEKSVVVPKSNIKKGKNKKI